MDLENKLNPSTRANCFVSLDDKYSRENFDAMIKAFYTPNSLRLRWSKISKIWFAEMKTVNIDSWKYKRRWRREGIELDYDPDQAIALGSIQKAK